MYARDEARIATPIGIVCLFGDDAVLDRIRIDPDGGDGGIAVSRGTAAAIRNAINQIEAWLAGERRDFDLPLASTTTPRGAALRRGMENIPYGETMSYGELARLIESSPRAIGQACARNPFPIVVPCHRVTGAGGALGHYSAGEGPKTKSWLLDHERKFSGNGLLL